MTPDGPDDPDDLIPPPLDSIPVEDTLILPPEERRHLPRIPDVELEREIGRGGMGVVYVGTQAYLDRRVAVKVLETPAGGGQDFAARFQREAKILASLSHPNIVSCYQAGTLDDGQCYLVMEYVEGMNLREWLDSHGRLSTKAALRVCRDLALALQCAHKANIIHRDVKPANALLQRVEDVEEAAFPFRVKLADLGLARPVSIDATMMDLTVQGAVMGSPPTMAPEQFDAPESVDYRADVYGLGCVLFHALTGQVAYPQETLTATIAHKMRDESPDPRRVCGDVPREVAAFLRQMLAKRPENRPQSYDEIVQRAEDYLARIDGMPRGKRRVSPLVLGLPVLLVGGSIGAWWFLRGGDGEELAPPTPPPEVVATGPESMTEGGESTSEESDPPADIQPRSDPGEEAPADPLPGPAAEGTTPPGPTPPPEEGGEASTEDNPDAEEHATEESAEPVTGSETDSPPSSGAEKEGDEVVDPDPPVVEGTDLPEETPGAAPLSPGERLNLIADNADDPLSDWTTSGFVDATWQGNDESEARDVLAASYSRDREADVRAAAARDLPAAPWSLEGDFHLVGRPKAGVNTGVRLVFAEGTSILLEQRRGEEAILAHAFREERDADEPHGWRRTGTIEALSLPPVSPSDYSTSRPAHFSVRAGEGETEILWTFAGQDAPRTWTLPADPAGNLHVPVRLVIEIEGGRALVGNLEIGRDS